MTMSLLFRHSYLFQYALMFDVNDLALQGGKREGAAPAQRQAPAPAPRQAGGSGFDDMDDEIPFSDPMKRRAFALSI